uniref:Uncharacterized protein n=1 Tax=Rhizophagus irregularis (strain DAOM 181602 / DAOM 197198 / MUCL 43194) TaxID=747089 RepID=U9UVX6_RHIID
MCIREIDNTKANLHGILLMIIIVKTLACVKIKTGKLLIDLITDFINEDSKWEELKKENDEGNNLSAFSNKEVGIKLELMQLDFNIYTLRWNKNIIYGDYRNYLKKFNQIKYKSSILTCHYLEDIFYRNEHQEINWKMAFDFLQRGTGNNKRFTDVDDNAQCNHVITDICARCEKEVESWEHIWSCSENSKSEYDVLIDTLIEIENKYNTPEEEVNYKIIRTLAKEIVTFMMAPSTILILGNQKRSREVTRELFNDGLYKICNDKSERRIIEEVWGKFYLKVRQEIWLDRCNKINEIEKSKSITKLDKKRNVQFCR